MSWQNSVEIGNGFFNALNENFKTSAHLLWNNSLKTMLKIQVILNFQINIQKFNHKAFFLSFLWFLKIFYFTRVAKFHDNSRSAGHSDVNFYFTLSTKVDVISIKFKLIIAVNKKKCLLKSFYKYVMANLAKKKEKKIKFTIASILVQGHENMDNELAVVLSLYESIWEVMWVLEL